MTRAEKLALRIAKQMNDVKHLPTIRRNKDNEVSDRSKD